MKIILINLLVFLFYIPFSYANQDTFDFNDSVYVLPVTINNKSYDFLIDTGSFNTFIDKKLVSQLGLKITLQLPARFHYAFNYANGNYDYVKNWETIDAPKISIGNNKIYLDKIVVTDLSFTYEATGKQIDGILGMDAINQYIWDFDIKNKKVYISSFNYNNNPPLKYNHCILYSFETFPFISLFNEDSYIDFILDTGSDTTSVNTQIIKKLNFKRVTAQSILSVNIDNNRTHSEVYYMKNFQLANNIIDSHPVYTISDENILGIDFLRRFDRFQINPIYHSFCFNEINTQKQYLFRVISVRVLKNKIELYSNDDSELKKWNLKNGDIIVSVNKIKYQPEQITQLRPILRHSENLDLEIQRDGKIIFVTIKNDN